MQRLIFLMYVAFLCNSIVYGEAKCILSNGQSYSLPLGAKGPVSVAFSPDGKLLATANIVSDDVTVFNVTKYSLKDGISYSLPREGTSPLSIKFSHDGKLLATGNFDTHDISLFNVTTGGLNGGLSHPLGETYVGPYSISFSPDGNFFAIVNYNNVMIFNVTNNRLSDSSTISTPLPKLVPSSISFSPDSKMLAVGFLARNIKDVPIISIFYVESGIVSFRKSYSVPPGSHPSSVSFSPSGNLLGMVSLSEGCCYNENYVTAFEVTGTGLNPKWKKTNMPLGSSKQGAYSIAFSFNGKLLATANAGPDGSISLFDVIGNTIQNSIPNRSYAMPNGTTVPSSIAFSPDGKLLATSSSGSNTVSIFMVECS